MKVYNYKIVSNLSTGKRELISLESMGAILLSARNETLPVEEAIRRIIKRFTNNTVVETTDFGVENTDDGILIKIRVGTLSQIYGSKSQVELLKSLTVYLKELGYYLTRYKFVDLKDLERSKFDGDYLIAYFRGNYEGEEKLQSKYYHCVWKWNVNKVRSNGIARRSRDFGEVPSKAETFLHKDTIYLFKNFNLELFIFTMRGIYDYYDYDKKYSGIEPEFTVFEIDSSKVRGMRVFTDKSMGEGEAVLTYNQIPISALTELGTYNAEDDADEYD